MQTCFTFRHESDPGLAHISVIYQMALDGSSSHLRLLSSFPTIGVTQDELHIVLNCGPESVSVRVGVNDKVFCAAEKVRDEIAKDIYCRLPSGKWRQTHTVHFECHGFRAKAKFEPEMNYN